MIEIVAMSESVHVSTSEPLACMYNDGEPLGRGNILSLRCCLATMSNTGGSPWPVHCSGGRRRWERMQTTQIDLEVWK